MRFDHIVTIQIFVDVFLDVIFHVSNDEQLILMLLIVARVHPCAIEFYECLVFIIHVIAHMRGPAQGMVFC